MKTLITRIGQLVTMKGVVDKNGLGITEDDLSVVEDAEIYFEDDIIRFAGPTDMIAGIEPDVIVDAKGGVVMPAFTDAHTHTVFAGSRHDEFRMRCEGKTYQEIAQAGGGINASTSAVANASAQDLADLALKRIETFNRFGVGVLEIKSGYGLDLENELKMLEAVALCAGSTKTTLVPTFLGAHAVPKSFKEHPDRYVDIVINEMLPAVAQKKLARFCDVFAETGYFSIAQARKILTAAKDLGLGLKVHADEFESLGGAELAAELGAVSADHLVAVSDNGIKAMADADVTAVLLPGTSLFLGQGRFAPARKIIDNGVAVALATDCNPGSSYTENLSLIMTLACTHLKMTVAETLAAVTYCGAKAVGLSDSHGALFPGKTANVALFDVSHFSAIPYHMGVSDMSDLWIDGHHVIGNSGVLSETLKEKIEPVEKEPSK